MTTNKQSNKEKRENMLNEGMEKIRAGASCDSLIHELIDDPQQAENLHVPSSKNMLWLAIQTLHTNATIELLSMGATLPDGVLATPNQMIEIYKQKLIWIGTGLTEDLALCSVMGWSVQDRMQLAQKALVEEANHMIAVLDHMQTHSGSWTPWFNRNRNAHESYWKRLLPYLKKVIHENNITSSMLEPVLVWLNNHHVDLEPLMTKSKKLLHNPNTPNTPQNLQTIVDLLQALQDKAALAKISPTSVQSRHLSKM